MLNLLPQMTLTLLYLHGFRIRVNLSQDQLNLLRLQINDIIHDALCQKDMLTEKVEIEIGLLREWIHHIRIEVNGQQTTTIIRAERNLATWIGRDRAET